MRRYKRYRFLEGNKFGGLYIWYGTLGEIAEQAGYDVGFLIWVIKMGKHYTDPTGRIYMLFELEDENDASVRN